jgi:hypothetical protein
MAITNRVLPISNKNANSSIPKAAIQSITMAIRVGSGKFAIGYVNEFGWDATRDVKSIHQIEPYPDGTFDNSKTLAHSFGSTNYWPGEPVEVIPGKVDVVTITLKRYVLYTSNLLAACMRLEAAGTEEGDSKKATLNSEVNNVTSVNKYVSLIQQVRPIELYQMYISPTTGQVVFGRRFEECWFTKIAETIPTGENNEAILEDGELKCARIRPYSNMQAVGTLDGTNP